MRSTWDWPRPEPCRKDGREIKPSGQRRYVEERLLFRRQFVLGPRFLEGFPAWKRIDLGSQLRLTVHPDLPTSRVDEGEDSILLLGFILDPDRPANRDVDIIVGLLRHLEEGGTRESLIRLTDPLGGRWILLVEAGQERWLFHDPCGHRGVYFTEAPKPLWCASQPGILAEILGLSMDRERLRFYRTYRRKDPQYGWPGNTSPYPGILHLQPNHSLDLRTRASSRHWPQSDLQPRDTDEVVAENARLLRGIIESASRRFPLSLGITAGHDTRTLLAASRAIRDRLYCFTAMWWHMNWSSSDIRVPSALLSRLNLPHHVIVCPSHMDKAFERIFRRSVATAHACYGPIVQAEARAHPQERACMMGTSMTITANSDLPRLLKWRPQTDLDNPDVETLAWCDYKEDPFSITATDRWRSGVPETNVPILDLFYWEEREGNLEAMSFTEWDLAFESFSPYNCRRFLANSLCLPRSFRGKPSYGLHESLMRHMWPEVLSEPFNPSEEPSIVSTVFNSISQLREKIDKKSPRTIGLPVISTFQRHPWLTDLARVGWMTHERAAADGGKNPGRGDRSGETGTGRKLERYRIPSGLPRGPKP